MLYYADREHEMDTRASLDGILSLLDQCYHDLSAAEPRSLVRIHPLLVNAVITLGEVHQGVADLRFTEEDEACPETDALMRAGVRLGRCVYVSHRALRQPAHPPLVGQLAQTITAAQLAVEVLRGLDLPEKLSVRIPEGYAFYSLYPEMYFASLERVLAEMPSAAGYFVLGIRTIGTSLAALVAGALEELGLAVQAETVRPRGHPFDRYVRLQEALRARLLSGGDKTFLIVDEGPGLTCSSFLSVVRCLGGAGVPSERMAILSAWQGSPSVYASDELRFRWSSQRVFYTDAAAAFDDWRSLLPHVDATLGDTPSGIPESWQVDNLSYGEWRSICYSSVDVWPVIHRPTERTKLLLTPLRRAKTGVEVSVGDQRVTKASREQREPAECLMPTRHFLAKFAGLGTYGEEKLERAQVLSQAGFIPAVHGPAYGFILSDFVDGIPLSQADLCPELMERMADYYAFVSRSFRVPAAPRFDQLSELILYNSRQALGMDAAPFVERWSPLRYKIDALPLARLDARPFPHEWVDTGTQSPKRYLKTDAADHCLDHTLVGEQSILWDLAGACEEWEMNASQVEAFMIAWRHEADQVAPPELLDFFRAAYLSFRAAALHYAIHSTNEEQIRKQLQHQEFTIHLRLREILQDPNRAELLSSSCSS